MRAILAVARNTFREAVRDRVLYLFLGFAVILLVSSKLFGMLTVGDESKIIKDLGLAGIQFFSMLISVMMSVMLISREVERRTVFIILSKPVRRWQFLLGKYLGLVATVTANLVLMAVIFVMVLLLVTGGFDPRLLLAVAMILLEMVLVAAFATLFAVLSTPILGAVLTLAIFVIGHVSEDLWMLTAHLRSGWAEPLIAAVYYLLPNLERFNFKTEVVHELAIPASEVAWTVVYGLAYTAFVLILACSQFNRKDLA
jgi:ABC-type transport system involved in multi-copper enzyme maturation permease subunit